METILADKSNYGKKRDTSSIKYVVIHYTANDGDSDRSNALYFQRNKNLKASAHYFVDDDSVTQSVPDDYVAYSVGGAKYKDCATTGGGKLYKKATNANTINIELCDTQKDGSVYPTKATIQNALELTRHLMEKYKIPQDNVIRHFDVNGKHCPAYWIEDGKWFNEFWNLLTKTTVVNGATDEIPATEDKKTEPAVSSEYKVGATYSVICAAINVRKAPGMNEALVGYKNLSADAKKHSNGGSALLKGTKVTCQEVKVVGSETWIKIPSGWCCAKNSVKTLIK